MKIFLMTILVKTILGYLFIQELKQVHRSLGSQIPHDPIKELLVAAILPSPVFLVIGLFSFVLVWTFTYPNQAEPSIPQNLGPIQ